jgi:hypothetical protein
MITALVLLAQTATATPAPAPAPSPCPAVLIAVERDGTRHVLRAPREDLGKQVRLFLTDGTTVRIDKTSLDEKESKRATDSASGCPLDVNEIVSVPGKTADQLYSSVLAWVPAAFKNTKAVTELADRASGRIVLKGTAEWSRTGFGAGHGYLSFTITVEVKDSRYRYSIGSFTSEGSPFGYGPVTDTENYSGPMIGYGDQKNWDAIQHVARDTSGSLAASLKAAMAKPPEEW